MIEELYSSIRNFIINLFLKFFVYTFQIFNLWFIEKNLLIVSYIEFNYILQFEIINLFFGFHSKRKRIMYTFQILLIDNRKIIFFDSKLSISSLDFSCTLYTFQISNLWFVEKNLLIDNRKIILFDSKLLSSLDFSFETKDDRVHFSNFTYW